jgi:hypothetical protein
MSKSVRLAFVFTVAVFAVGLWAYVSIRSDAALVSRELAGVDPTAMTLAAKNVPELPYRFEPF